MKSKSTGSKSAKATTNKANSKAKPTSNVVRLRSKANDSRFKSNRGEPKLESIKGSKVEVNSSKTIVATKVSVTQFSVAERLTSSRLVKGDERKGVKNGVSKGDVVALKSKNSSLTLVEKKSAKAKIVSKAPITTTTATNIRATKISRSEPVSPGSKVITGKFTVESTTAITAVATKSGADKVVEQQGQSHSAITFKTGDKIVYPGHGVGEIEGIRTTVLGGQEHHIYNIKILDSGMKVMVPVSQASAVGLRKIVDKKAIDEVFSILKDRDFKIDTQTWNRRFREYSQKIKTGSVFEIAVVLRDLLVLSADKELSFGEKKMLDTAEGLLVSEIAIAKARPHDKVVGELRALFA